MATHKHSPYSAIIHSPVGKLGFNIVDDKLVNLDFLIASKIKLLPPGTSLAKEIVKQLEHYFKNSGFKFDLPIQLEGTIFQQRVWQALQTIATGNALSYGMLAQQLKSSARAIGNACRRNPVPIIVPCHRIVAANGIGGFNGARQGQPLNIKSWLLWHEAKKV